MPPRAPAALPVSAPRPVAGRVSVRWSACVLVALLTSAGPARSLDFTRITGAHPTLEGGGGRASSWIDADGDGDLDLYATRGGTLNERNLFYRNDGGGSFAYLPGNAAALDSLRADGCSWGDYDNDGDEDLFVASWWGEVNGLFENQGDGSFARVTTGAAVTTGTHSEDCAWADYDRDGDLDLFVANSDLEDNLLYRNDGGGTLTPVLTGPIVNEGRSSRHGAWADYDNDGDLDLYVTSEGTQSNKLYRNFLEDTGTLFFQEVDAGTLTSETLPTLSASWGDYDNDGDLDLVQANFQGNFNSLWRNELVETGTATFTALASSGPAQNRGFSVGTQWADLDNDADLDLLITNGFGNPGQLRRNFLYRNDGGDLVRIQEGPIHDDQGWSYGGSFGDYDDDGDLDLHVATWLDNNQQDYLYRNEAQANGNHWLAVRCVGTTSNRSGIGARIRVRATVGGSPVWQMRDVSGSDGYCSQNLRQHFGLGDAAVVDSLVVRWPNGLEQVLESVAVDQLLTVVEPTDVGVIDPPRPATGTDLLRGAFPNPFRAATSVAFDLPSPADVTVAIHDVSGRRVRALERGPRAAGPHESRWDGTTDAGATAAAGVYFVRLTARTGEAGRHARIESARLLRLR